MTKTVYQKLVALAAYHSNLYYNNDDPELPDEAYDRLTQDIKVIEKNHPEWVSADSPTQHVGGMATAKDLPKVTHHIFLQSLNDVFSIDEVSQWYTAVKEPAVTVEEKIDGLTIALTYINGKLVQGATRGDGAEGEDVTENAKCLQDVPTEFDLPAGIASHNILMVRAEVYQPVLEFERINAELAAAGKKLCANPRNCAAGSLRVKDPAITAERKLSAIAFNILYAEGWDHITDPQYPQPMRSQHEDIALLNKLHFHGVTQTVCHTADEVADAIAAIATSRDGLPYWIDGAVVKVDDIATQHELGGTTKFPHWATAYKYPPERKLTTIRQIAVQVGRTGVLTPVAKFDPIALAGTTVTSATLHNQNFMDERCIGIGAVIEVLKSGDIIPKVVGVPTPASEPFRITHCPVCGAVAVVSAEGIASCGNIACPAQKARFLEFFCSKDVMDIAGMGPAMVSKLIDAQLLNTVQDIYELPSHASEIAVLDNMGEKSVQSLITAIEASKSNDIDRLIKGFGIPGVGRHIGKILAHCYPSLQDIMALKQTELESIQDVGVITADAMYDFFQSPDAIEMVAQLERQGVNTKSKAFTLNRTEGAFTGMTFVLTGTLPSMSRDEAKNIIEEHGGTISGSISKKTTFLVAGDAAGSKLDKAKSLGVSILSESQLMDMIAQN